MLIEVHRNLNGEMACMGRMSIDGAEFCLTLEDPVRDLGADGSGKIYGKTAIPAGEYKVSIDYSPKFKKDMVHILNVPFFTGIRIHSGNDADDTLGCILVGQSVDAPGHIRGGSNAMPILFDKIKSALTQGPVTIVITDDFNRS